MYLALRELRVARGRFVLVGAVIALVAMLTTMLSGLANGLVDDGISGLRRLPLTHLAFQQGADETFSRSTLNAADLERWSGVDGVEASPLGVSFVNARTASGTTVDIALFGVPARSFLAPRHDAEQALAGPPGLVLSHEFEEQGIRVGDELTIVGVDEQVPVLGFTYAGSYGHVDIAFTSLETWQSLLYGDNARGRFSAIALAGDPDAIAAAAEETDGLAVVTKEQAYAGSPGYAGETQTMAMIRWFLLVISALIVGAFFVVWTMQRARQIALLKALGASRGYVGRDAVGQLLVVLLVATALGGLVAFGVGGLVERSAVPFRLAAAPALSALGLLVGAGLLGCLAGIRRVVSVDPALALRSSD
ncbi:ABC transporter permease [Nocardioides nitrophenolicus]|uniref:ABC transporter permease n=1 Tax=Nocardioides nitrophenolicus TaxID=60489 RepID=UPI00195B0627|nr:ABC transporter permease [Nocardioides nitrophenolicus]MBM7517722.1 putative ABC transport system permease protein [Nocardioides nitrophenolicus]